MDSNYLNFIVYVFALVIFSSILSDSAGLIGVDYGRVANDLPQPARVGHYKLTGVGGQSWCVANENANEGKLQLALVFICGLEEGVHCGPILPEGICYEPRTLVAHASYAFNSYYQKKEHEDGSCDFGGIAHVVTQSPKFGDCVFPANSLAMNVESSEEILEMRYLKPSFK